MTKILFYTSLAFLLIFETANVFFIMPMSGQEINSLDLAYFLHSWNWVFRICFGTLAMLCFVLSTWNKKWLPLLATSVVAIIIYMCNYVLAADAMFYQPDVVMTKNSAENKVDSSRLVIGVEKNGIAKAYPIQYIGYHHQVLDSLGNTPIMVTYCTVCRTGRIYEPMVNGKYETFRLVGMDHFNAMFEDKTTGSWWRQATGEAVAGKLKGEMLPELLCSQMTLGQWFVLYPNSKVFQADPEFQERYDSMSVYETVGKSKLTKTDTSSWKDKSWVVGIKVGGKSKAFDWNQIKKERCINDMIGSIPILVAMLDDNKSFIAFQRPDVRDSC
ncbi:MAG: DUF3179 domain-containing protein, partial [Saprospiraceae bacterium]|nr:DUF3179 domain-containing protein [Saprospiraceae bacterium]